MYVYISESEDFKQFDDPKALYWSIKDIEYGNWYIGENKDGVFINDDKFELTEVN